MPPLQCAWFFIGLLAAERLVELGISRRHEKRLRAAGGREYDGTFTRTLMLFHLAWFAAFAIESFLRPAALHLPRLTFWLSFLLLQSGRYWCIVSLGRFWNTKILRLPGSELVRRGPYRWVKHPNYLIVAVELIFYPAAFGNLFTALAGGGANLFMLHRRIKAEEAALRPSPVSGPA